MAQVLLKAIEVKKYYPYKRTFWGTPYSYIKAVDGVSFSITEGETFGIVGESGCGKSTLSRTLMGLEPPTAGKILFDGQELSSKRVPQSLKRQIQMIFQDPIASLNPRWPIGELIREPLLIHKICSPAKSMERAQEMMELCGLPRDFYSRYPNEFSGGQCQRVGIARALILNPRLVICDEPVSALDVSVRSQILNLLLDLQEKMGLTYIFVSHDLAVIRTICDRVGVMYLGKLVELAGVEELFSHPLHPYTLGLISSIPIPDPRKQRSRKRMTLKGDVPSPVNLPSGCRFYTRCSWAKPRCQEEEPILGEISSGHWVSCHYPLE